MGKRLLSFIAICMFAVSMAFAQQKVTGTVIDDLGEPVVGASVLVKGTSVGAATDINGKFTISNVPSSAKTLVVSYIGMKAKEVTIKPSVKVVLESDAKALNEQLVVAFGTSTKEAFTGSASVVKAENIEKHVTANVANTLVGSVAGLTMRGSSGMPGSDSGNINIRGIASMYASTDPLIIVDGAPYPASLSNINPDDVESISVLKDASSAALYGARGAAGVIIITTKKGKTAKAQFNVNMKWGSNSRAVGDYDRITNPAEYYETAYKNYYNYSFYELGNTNEYANAYANSTMLKQLGYNIYKVPEGEQLIGLNGKINPNATLGNVVEGANGEKYYYTNDDWTKATYKNAFRQEYDINASASTDRTNFYVSLGYLDEDGVYPNTSYKRLTARAKFDYQALSWLRLGVNAGYVNTKTEGDANFSTGSLGSTNLMYYASNIAPIYPIYVRVLDANGNPVIRQDEYGHNQYDYGVAGQNYPNNRAFLQTGNPLGSNNDNYYYNKGNQLNATGFVDVRFTDYLKFNATSTINWGHTNGSNYESMLYGPKKSVNGQLTKTQTDSYRQNHLQTLVFNKDFNDHNLGITIGHEYYRTETTYLMAAAQGLFAPYIQEINAAANNQYDSGSYTSVYNTEGYFGNVLYNYQQKYFAQIATRRDACSRFAKENRWGNFWSVGGGWLINKESFFKADWVDMLKLKASIGQKGNDGLPSNWYYTDTYNLTPSGKYNMSPSLRVSGNSDITWETTTAFNVGAEFDLFRNRLSGSIEYYYNKTTDLLFWLSVPESAGYRGYYGNLGDIRNAGVEFSLSVVPVRTKNIEWKLFANASHNTTKILKLPESKTATNGGFSETNSNIQMWYQEGKPLYSAFLYEYAGVSDKGEALYWYDEDLSPLGKAETNNTAKAGSKHSGKTTNIGEATRYAQESLLPKVTGGFGTEVKIYDFDISASFDYQIGGKVYDSAYAGLMGNIETTADGGAFHKDLLKAWTPNNTSSDIPRLQLQDQYTSASSTRWLTNASYLNFQSFTVGYNVPAKAIKSIGLSRLRVYCSGENIALWSARKGLDPRFNFEGNDYLPNFAPVRSIMGGIQVSF